MHVFRSMSLALLVSLAAAGCGDGGTDPDPNPTPTLASVRLVTSTFDVEAGETVTVVPQAIDTDGNVISGVTGYVYTSSDESVAEPRSAGSFLGVQAGSATLTVSLTRDGVTASADAAMTVTGALPSMATVVAGNSSTDFTPAALVVALDAEVTYSFGTLVHNVTYGSTPGAPANIPNTTNDDVARTFDTAGDFTYDCTIHPGMSGEVLVR